MCCEALTRPDGDAVAAHIIFLLASISKPILALITRLGGRPYPEYLRERIVAPLAMADTSFDLRAARARVAPVHGIDPAGALGEEEALRYFISLTMPGAGLWSTAADLVAFGQALLNDGRRGDGRLLSPPFIELMTRDHTAGVAAAEGEPTAHYGLGWYTRSLESRLRGSPRVFEHGGATGTRLWIDPDYDLVYAYLTNGFNLDNPAQDAALQAVYGAFVS